MIDIFFIGTIINIIWQIFTILFLLYRFTTFFNVILGFTKFCKRIFEGIIYVKNSIYIYITKRNGYSILNDDEINEANFTQQTSKIKNIFNKCYLFFYPNTTSELPFYQTTELYTLHPLYDSNYSTNLNNNLYSSTSINLNNSNLYDNSFYTNLKNMTDSDNSDI